MLDVCLLGTGGMMPLPGRRLTALMTRYNGSSLLIDCGEGTQVAIKEKGWTFKPIDAICFTHSHADHISGLPGLLLTMGNTDRREPLTMIGPKGLERVVTALRTIAPELPFSIEYIELDKDTPNPIRVGAFEIHHCPADHMVKCFAYRIDLKRKGKFDVKKAEQLKLPKPLWNKLQKEGSVEHEGKTYTADMVMGENRKGISVAYCTDSRPVDRITKFVEGVQLFICEGMYGEDDKLEKAKGYKHMTFREAATLAKQADVEEMWLTHYSPSLIRPDEYMDMVRDIFPKAYPGKDGKTMEMNFEED